METKPEVFIIESLSFENEKDNLFEGRILSNILELNGKRCQYYYIRTDRELEEVVDIFYESKYRYLHLSCHGSPKAMATTLDLIPFSRLGEIFEPCLHDRRLFVSACVMVNNDLAKAIMPVSNCYSIIGPSVKVAFSDSAILWASFYHLMFRHDSSVMKRETLMTYCRRLADLYSVPLNYFSASRSDKKGYRFTPIKPRPTP
jgi:hypothetical protein